MANQNNPSRKKSKTSSFGVSKRESHDASQFYNSKLYKTLQNFTKTANNRIS